MNLKALIHFQHIHQQHEQERQIHVYEQMFWSYVNTRQIYSTSKYCSFSAAHFSFVYLHDTECSVLYLKHKNSTFLTVFLQRKISLTIRFLFLLALQK